MKALATVSLAILLLGCQKDIKNKEAVQQAIVQHLAKRTDMMAMDVQITGLVFRNNEADATVSIQAKSGPAAGSGMQMKYILEEKGNHWEVKGRAGSGAIGQSPHGAQGMPGMGAVPQSESPALPPGHPPVSGSEGTNPGKPQ